MIVGASSQPRALELEGRVIRCGCNDGQKAATDWHALSGQVCPRPRAIEDVGLLAAWYRNPFKRLAYRMSQFVRGKRSGVIRMGV